MTWLFPLKMKKLGPTSDSMSFQHIDVTSEVEIPIKPHVGAFGIERRHDVHKGVDLYCPQGTEVFAVEDSVLCHLRPFTGEVAGSPWWENTWAVSLAGESGIVVYGEIRPYWELGGLDNPLIPPREIKRGELIGFVKTVLSKDKGRPTSMLHLALHNHGVLSNGVWEKGEPQPVGLLDPTQLLVESEAG